MCCEDKFAQQLHERGLRMTPQREMVLHVLHDAGDPATAEEIHHRVRALSPAVDLSTIYRTLDLLAEIRLVSALDLGGGERRYELLSLNAPHHHLHCLRCGKLIAIAPQSLQPMLDGLARTHGFGAQMEHWVIPGLCQECQRDADGVAPSTTPQEA